MKAASKLNYTLSALRFLLVPPCVPSGARAEPGATMALERRARGARAAPERRKSATRAPRERRRSGTRAAAEPSPRGTQAALDLNERCYCNADGHTGKLYEMDIARMRTLALGDARRDPRMLQSAALRPLPLTMFTCRMQPGTEMGGASGRNGGKISTSRAAPCPPPKSALRCSASTAPGQHQSQEMRSQLPPADSMLRCLGRTSSRARHPAIDRANNGYPSQLLPSSHSIPKGILYTNGCHRLHL